MEQDPETKGNGNSYTTEFRQYDPRIGRWMSLDPMMMEFPEQSPYLAMDNDPISLTDPDGDCPTCLMAFITSTGVEFLSQVVTGIYSGKDVLTAIKTVKFGKVLEEGIWAAGEALLFGPGSSFEKAMERFNNPQMRVVVEDLIETIKTVAGTYYDAYMENGFDGVKEINFTYNFTSAFLQAKAKRLGNLKKTDDTKVKSDIKKIEKKYVNDKGAIGTNAKSKLKNNETYQNLKSKKKIIDRKNTTKTYLNDTKDRAVSEVNSKLQEGANKVKKIENQDSKNSTNLDSKNINNGRKKTSNKSLRGSRAYF